MRLSLFSRLTIGYLTIFLIVAAATSHAIYQLRHFGAMTEAIVRVDNRILDYEKTLADLLLSQSRAEQKYVITKDEAWYLQYARLKGDTEQQLAAALAISSPDNREYLAELHRDYQRYAALVNEESALVRRGRRYAQAKYKADKDQLLDDMLGYLQALRFTQERSTFVKVKALGQEADRASVISGWIALACLAAIIALSLLITKSITKPIAVLKKKTSQIAAGNFNGGGQVKSPPEIAELDGALNLMCQQLRALDQMKSDFYASMSHELRTPLTSIKEGTQLLLDGVGGETTEKQRKLLTILAEESRRLISVVNSLLDLAKMEAGMMTYEFETGNIDPLIKRTVAEITPLVEAKKIVFHSVVPSGLPAVRMDPERMLLVLRNLLSNAVKFTPNGGTVEIKAAAVNGNLQISVKDSGPGIAADNLASIFDKYQQGRQTGSLSPQGTGLGLAIVKSIISSHGGRIWAESRLGHGSQFVFVLHS